MFQKDVLVAMRVDWMGAGREDRLGWGTVEQQAPRMPLADARPWEGDMLWVGQSAAVVPLSVSCDPAILP